MKTSFAQVPITLAELLPVTLQPACETTVCNKGELLFSAGDKPLNMFFVESGEVVLQRLGQQGVLLVLQRVRHGFVAEASLQSARYHCDARVAAKARVTRIGVAQIQSAIAADPAFAARWISMLSQELRRMRLQCERLSLNRVQDRLLHLMQTEGSNGSLPLGAGLKSLAGQLGVTHEALYRCVASLEKAQRLQRGDSFIALLPPSDAS